MFNKDVKLLRLHWKKRKRDSVVLEMSNCPETSFSGGVAIRPDVVLLQGFSRLLLPAVAAPTPNLYTPLLPSSHVYMLARSDDNF